MMLTGSGGFFVDRATGAVMQLGSGEVFHTSVALAAETGVRWDGNPSPAAIHYLITQPADERQPLLRPRHSPPRSK
jgi:hypothetical protein